MTCKLFACNKNKYTVFNAICQAFFNIFFKIYKKKGAAAMTVPRYIRIQNYFFGFFAVFYSLRCRDTGVLYLKNLDMLSKIPILIIFTISELPP